MPEEKEIEDYSALVALAKENPYRFFSVQEVGKILGFGRSTMTALINAGAPIVARKMNPDHVKQWLSAKAGDLGKISE